MHTDWRRKSFFLKKHLPGIDMNEEQQEFQRTGISPSALDELLS